MPAQEMAGTQRYREYALPNCESAKKATFNDSHYTVAGTYPVVWECLSERIKMGIPLRCDHTIGYPYQARGSITMQHYRTKRNFVACLFVGSITLSGNAQSGRRRTWMADFRLHPKKKNGCENIFLRPSMYASLDWRWSEYERQMTVACRIASPGRKRYRLERK